MDRLDHLDLNRATLDRQLLPRRAPLPAWNAIEHLAGLQAQAPRAPYVGLWTRLAGFGHDGLEDLLAERIVVRAHLMRDTPPYRRGLRSLLLLFQPLMDRALAYFARACAHRPDELQRRHHPAAEPRYPRPARRALASRRPDHDPNSLARAGRDVPAPLRFLPEYDNLLLSFADRSRVIRGARPLPLPPGNGGTAGTLLMDGFWAADWRITRGPDRAVLEIRPFRSFGRVPAGRIGAEGSRLLEFAAPAAAHDVRFSPVS